MIVFFFIRIRNVVGEVMFIVCVIYSLLLMMLVVYVFYYDLLSVVCYLLGLDILFILVQVCDKCFIKFYSKFLYMFLNYDFFVYENYES